MARSLRAAAPANQHVTFTDEWCGTIEQFIAHEVGDFVIWRADGVASYHLATVVDDSDLGVTRVVRGKDLILSTPRQILLQSMLGLATPTYAHHALVTVRGRKLGKSIHAPPVHRTDASSTLVAALRFLGQNTPNSLEHEDVEVIWDWAAKNWQPAALSGPLDRPTTHG